MKSLLIGLPSIIVNADITEPDVVFALPARTVVLGWQTAFPGGVPGAVDVDLDVAMDATGPWTTLDTSTSTSGEFRTIDTPTAARFGRIAVNDSSSEQITVSVIAKVANP